MVVQAFAECFGDDRKVGVLLGDLQQIASTQTLQPKRRPLPRGAARHHQSAGGVLAEAQGEQCTIGQFVEDHFAHVVRRQTIEQVEHRFVAFGEANQHTVIVMQALGPIAEPLAEAMLDGEPKREVNRTAKRAEQDDLPIAKRIARSFDLQRAVGR